LCIVVCLVPALRQWTLSYLSTLSKFDSAFRCLLRLPVSLSCLTSSRISTTLKKLLKILSYPLDEAVFGLKPGMLGRIYLLILSDIWRWIISIFYPTSQVNLLDRLPDVSLWILSVFFQFSTFKIPNLVAFHLRLWMLTGKTGLLQVHTHYL